MRSSRQHRSWPPSKQASFGRIGLSNVGAVKSEEFAGPTAKESVVRTEGVASLAGERVDAAPAE